MARPALILKVGIGFMTTLALGIAVAQQHGSQPVDGDMKVSIHSAADTKWVDGPPSLPKGAKMAVLEGDPGKEGMFVFRLKLPDGYRVPPHTHPKVERITVIQGQFNVGMGDKSDDSKMQPMPAGAYGYWPAGMVHFVKATGETILQFHGTGPWTINYVNASDDPRNAKRGAIDGTPAARPVAYTDAKLEVGCGLCMYKMPGADECQLAVMIDGKPHLVEGKKWHNHDYCERKIPAVVSGELKGDKFIASSLAEAK
jgi:quercetin dioxygenase-like cupin family protein